MENEDFVIIERDVDGESDLSNHDIAQVTPEDLERIRAWLLPTEFDSEGSDYQKHVQAHTPATGDWLFQTEQYKNWHESESGVLWIQGIPGSGKSVVTANLIRSLKEETTPVLFFFSRRIIKSNSEPQNLARDCLFQLLDHSIALQTRLKRVMQLNQSIEAVKFSELWKILLSGISTVPKVYLLFDALDELAVEEENFLQCLLELGQRKPRSIRMLITSRPLPHIQKALNHPSVASLRLAGRMVERDISLYINHRISSSQCRRLTMEDQSAVKHILCQKGQGLFLYARLMLDEILSGTAPVHDLLQNLPNSLEEMYVDLLHENSVRCSANLQFQSSLLSWVTHASRPLRVTEIASLVNSLEDRAGLAENQDAKVMVRTCCGPLLDVLDNETVQVIHHSFTEFLLDSNRPSAQSNDGTRNWFPAFTPAFVHRFLTLSCIDYLRSGCFESWAVNLDADEETMPPLNSEDSRRLMIQFQFLRYASQKLLFHASKFDTLDALVLSKYDSFFRNGDHSFESWKDLLFSKKKDSLKPKDFRPIHVAAQAGLTAFVAYLLRQGQVPDQIDSNERTAAIYASMNGHAETLAVLLDYKCSITLADSEGLTSLHHAAKGNHVQIIRCLLAAGVDPMSPKAAEDKDHYSWRPSTIGKTAIQYACELGSQAAVSTLLDCLNSPKRATVLPHFAAVTGQAKILSYLLQYPEILANIDKKNTQGNTALYLAARVRDPATVRVLLNHGADIYARSEELTISTDDSQDIRPVNGKNGHTALQGWAYPVHHLGYHVENQEEWEKVGALLLEAGSDLESTNDLGETVLFAWVDQFRHGAGDRIEKFVSLLLEYGANPCAISNDGSTPLHKPQRPNTNGEILGMFIKAGADINHPRAKDLVTPLIAAAKFQCVDAVRAYTENGADPKAQDVDGNTALHCISKSRLLELEHMQDWLSVSDPSIRNKQGETCLYNLRYGNGGQGRVDAIPLLVEHGLDIESRNYKGRTALLSACENGEIQFIAGLLRNGASATSKDFEGKSCLHMIAKSHILNKDTGPIGFRNTSDVMESLVKAGADINGIDFSGNSIFHDAVESMFQFETMANFILKLGGVANIANHRGQTPLHKMAGLNETEPDHYSRRGVPERIDFLLKSSLGNDLHARDNQGMTAIHYAASVSEVHTWKFIEAGADVRAQASDGKTPLHYAAEYGQSNVVGFLCKLYKDKSWSVDESDDSLRTALHYAARSGRLEAVYHLLNSGANPLTKDRNSLTPLHLAAEHQTDHSLRKERRRKKLPHWRTLSPGMDKLHPYIDLDMYHRGQTLLPLAISHEDEAYVIQDVVRLLLTAGAELAARSRSNQTAYEISLLMGNEDIAAELLSRNPGIVSQSPLADQWNTCRIKGADTMVHDIDTQSADVYALIETAVSLKSEAVLDALLKAGVDPMATGPGGLTAIHTIAHWGLVSLMAVVAAHIDLNAFSPPLLHVAASRELSNIQMVDLLLKLGVDVNANYQEIPERPRGTGIAIPSYTAGHILAMGEQWWNIAALDSLCNAGADLEVPDGEGNSMLQCALNGSKSGSWGLGFWRDETLDVLLKYGVDINSVSPKNGLTPLKAALEAKRSCKVIQKILDCGADITLGKVPAIFAAIETEDVKVVAAILDAGADVNALYFPEKIEKWGGGPKVKTPLLAAAFKDGLAMRSDNESDERGRREEIITLLLERGADPLADLLEEKATVFHAISSFHGLIAPILKSGVALEVRDGDGRTPLLAACHPPPTSSYRVTEDETAPRALIEAGVDVNAVDNTGSTALHLAVQAVLVETVKLLLSKGASASVKNNDGLTPLYYALSHFCSKDKIKMTKTLIDAGADPLITGPKGETPLHLLTPLLIQLSPADCQGTLGAQGLPTDTAAYLSEVQALYSYFISSGFTPNSRDNAGNTPLFPYVKQVKCRCEYFIIKPPSEDDIRAMFDTHDVLATNDAGDTLLHAVAAREEQDETDSDGLWLFKELLKRGVDPRRENNAGVSALDVAAACGKGDVLELFAREE